jgi:hypothetical protein
MGVNLSRLYEGHSEPSAGYNPTQLGFPLYIAANSQWLEIPYVSFSTNSAFQVLSADGANRLPCQSVQLMGSWTRVMGKHVLKLGGDAPRQSAGAQTAHPVAGAAAMLIRKRCKNVRNSFHDKQPARCMRR